MRLPHPLIVGAGPLGDDLDTVESARRRRRRPAVLRSLYEEEITGEQMDAFLNVERPQRIQCRGRRRMHPTLTGPSDPRSIWNISGRSSPAVPDPRDGVTQRL
jgi:hypothetical protein